MIDRKVESIDSIVLSNPKNCQLEQIRNVTECSPYNRLKYMSTDFVITGKYEDGRAFKIVAKDVQRLALLYEEYPKWEETPTDEIRWKFKCSECGGFSDQATPYCPHCGVKIT